MRQLVKLAELPHRQRRPLPRPEVVLLRLELLRVFEHKVDDEEGQDEGHEAQVQNAEPLEPLLQCLRVLHKTFAQLELVGEHPIKDDKLHTSTVQQDTVFRRMH